MEVTTSHHTTRASNHAKPTSNEASDHGNVDLVARMKNRNVHERKKNEEKEEEEER